MLQKLAGKSVLGKSVSPQNRQVYVLPVPLVSSPRYLTLDSLAG